MPLEIYGNYQLVEKLAMGGMAQLFLARRLKAKGQDRMVVLKRILPHLAEDAAFVTMFLDEARIAARLHHPNVVEILDLGAEGDSYFITMEYIHGEDLRRIGKRSVELSRRMPPTLVCRVLAQACRGLDYAHRRTDAAGKALRIVHRDVSPQNILVGFDGNVKVVDFGIAKAVDKATVTASGVIKGKHAYMSPEQALGRDIDHRTDVFALGIVLYETLTGTRLFRRATDLQTLKAVSECKVEPPSRMFPAVPQPLDAIIMKALSKDLTVRYQRAEDLAAALEAWLSDRPDGSVEALGRYVSELFADRLAKEEREGKYVPTHSAADIGSVKRKDGRRDSGKYGPTASVKVERKVITDVHPAFDPSSPLESRTTDVGPAYRPAERASAEEDAAGQGEPELEPQTLSGAERPVIGAPGGTAPFGRPATTAMYGKLDPLQQKTFLEPAVKVATPLTPPLRGAPNVAPLPPVAARGAPALLPVTEPEPELDIVTDAVRRFDPSEPAPTQPAAPMVTWPWWLAAGITTVAVAGVVAKVVLDRSEVTQVPPAPIAIVAPAPVTPDAAVAVAAPPPPEPPKSAMKPFNLVPVTQPALALTRREGKLFASLSGARLEAGAQLRIVGPPRGGTSQRDFYGLGSVVEVNEGEAQVMFDDPEALPDGLFVALEEDKLAAPYAKSGSEPRGAALALVGSLALRSGDAAADVALKNATDVDWTQCEIRLPDNRSLKLGSSVVVKAGATQWIAGSAFKPRGGGGDPKQREGFGHVKCAEGDGWLKAASLP